MGATLEALIELQDVELQIVDIRRQLAAKQRSMARQAAKVRSAEEAFAQAKADLKRTQVAADEADVDVKGRDANVNKLRDNLNTVRTNKEYAAILSQLNNEKADRTRVEARALELMSEVEVKRKSLGEFETTLESFRAKIEASPTAPGQPPAARTAAPPATPRTSMRRLMPLKVSNAD